MNEIPVLVGAPLDINEMLAADIAAGQMPPYHPGPGYVVRRCTGPDCGREMWVGPRGLALIERMPGILVVCMVCGVDLAAEVSGGEVTYRSLGGP